MSTTERTLPTPLYAVVGAGDVVVQEAKEAYDRLRNRAEAAQTRLTETRTRLADLPSDVNVDEIKAKLNREELRKVTAPYVETATDFYKDLAERGEGAVERLRTQPTVQENLDRVGKVYNDAVDLTEDALGAVSSQTRAVGDRAAALAGRAADKVQDAAVEIEEAGAKVADKVEEAAVDIEDAGTKVAAEAKTAAAKIGEVADTAKGRATKAAPAKKAPARKAPAKPAAKAAPTTAK
ncbi:heparin-binding hemagglutinin [Gordonia alkaliphila]|uniref:Heparin-binding hemagglutinin n=1 Tax=Gordonia alkaliphila TaxID=1053547 RepID=A0ABP8Z342_9ACTN